MKTIVSIIGLLLVTQSVSAADLILDNQTISDTQTFLSDSQIITSDFTVTPTGDVTLKAPLGILLGPNTVIQDGGVLVMKAVDVVDIDDDGLLDSWEITHFGNLSQDGEGDPDEDGVSNLEEFILGSNPTVVDSDEDGFDDGFEVQHASDPSDSDNTPDGLTLLDFEDQGWNTAATSSTQFMNLGTTGGPFSLNGDGSNQFAKMEFRFNHFGGSALHYGADADPGIHVAGPSITWGQRFFLETFIWRSEGTFGEVDLVLDEAGITPLRWFIDENEKLVLSLNDGQVSVTSQDPVFPMNTWSLLQVEIDLGQTDVNEGISFYVNGVHQALDPVSVYVSEITIAATDVPVQLLKRSTAMEMMVDFIRIVNNTNPTVFDPELDFDDDIFPGIDPGASVSILIHPPSVIKPVKNTLTSILNGDPIIIDDGAGVFYGIFQIEFALETELFEDGFVMVDIFVQRASIGDPFLKIGTAVPGPKPANETWTVHFFWDSRTAAEEWQDTTPFIDDLKLKFRVR